MTIINNAQATIDTVVPTLTIGQIQLSADRRSTKEKPLSDAERIRRVVLPANHWGTFSAALNDETNQSLTDVLRTALIGIANEKLRDQLATDPMLRLVNLQDYNIANLLAWNSESATSRGSITFTRDQVETWFATSATANAIRTKHAANPKLSALLELVATRFATLAAKNHGLKTAADADKLAALIDAAELADDAKNASLVTEIIARIDHISSQLKKKEAETSISMDDL